MSAKRRSAYAAFFIFHFLLVAAVSFHATLTLFKTHVVSPVVSDTMLEKLDRVPAALAPSEAPFLNFGQKLLATYTNAAGIEAGYGYFAPDIPPNASLVFEFHHANGTIEYGTPAVETDAGSLRLETLLAQAANAELPAWREELVKLLADSSRRFQPDIISIRAFFGSLSSPDLTQYKSGRRGMIFNCQYVYDFTYPRRTAPGPPGASKAIFASLPR